MQNRTLESILTEIQPLIVAMAAGDIDALVSQGERKGLRGILVDLDLAQLAQVSVQDPMFPTMFLMRMLVHVFFTNFATDAPFDFPRRSKQVSEFAKYIGQFYYAARAQSKESDQVAFTNLCEAIRVLYRLIVLFNQVASEKDMLGSGYLPVSDK